MAPAPDLRHAPPSAGETIFGATPCAAVVRQHRPLLTTREEESLRVAANRMWWNRVGALPVVEGGRLVGRLSEDDLLRVLAERVWGERDRIAAGDDPLPVWETVLADARVADAMTLRKELAVVDHQATLLEGMRVACAAAPHGTHARYLYVVDADADGREVSGTVSFRDVARFLTDVYDGTGDAGLFPSPEAAATARAAARHILDRSLGSLDTLGHEPVLADHGLSGVDAVLALWRGRRGYVITAFEDGAPMGIFTRRDLLGALSRPFFDLRPATLQGLVSAPVSTATAACTLCGLLKLMALDEFRHMPVLDADDRIRCVVSMWEAVAVVVAGA